MRRVVVVGNGMVGSRFADDLAGRCPDADITVLGAEPHEPYNRVLLSELVAGRVAEPALTLPSPPTGVSVLRSVTVRSLDRDRRLVTSADGRTWPYDVLVLATGSRARIPEVCGLTAAPAGVRPLRTLDDARAVVRAARPGTVAVVLGAGVLGLEVACGLADRGLRVTLAHAGPHVMDRQLDEAAAQAVVHALRRRGIAVRTGGAPQRLLVRDGRLSALALPDGEAVRADLLVLAAGTVPETALATAAGLAVGRGIVVDAQGRTDDPHVYAIGDCAQPPGGSTGLVGQGWDQARRLVRHLCDPRDEEWLDHAPAAFAATDVVRLKAHGLEVVTMGVGAAVGGPAHRAVRLSDPSTGRHVEVVVAGGIVVGATCVGAGPVAADLTAAYTRRTPVPADPAHLLLRPVTGGGPEAEPSVTLMPDRATVCRCNGVTKGQLRRSWSDGARTVADVARATRATTGCGGCTDAVCGLLDWLAESTGEGPGVSAGAGGAAVVGAVHA